MTNYKYNKPGTVCLKLEQENIVLKKALAEIYEITCCNDPFQPWLADIKAKGFVDD